jgi:hypothetical protein
MVTLWREAEPGNGSCSNAPVKPAARTKVVSDAFSVAPSRVIFERPITSEVLIA